MKMSRPKKEEYVPRSISEGKPSPVCISVEKFLEMEEEIKRLKERNSRYADKILKLKEQRKCLLNEYHTIRKERDWHKNRYQKLFTNSD